MVLENLRGDAMISSSSVSFAFRVTLFKNELPTTFREQLHGTFHKHVDPRVLAKFQFG